MKLPLAASREGTRLAIRVAPRASRTALAGLIGEGPDAALKIALQAPPVEGRANAALVEFLAKLLDVPRSAIEITGGQHSRNKSVLIRGRSPAQIAAILEHALSAV